MTWHWPHAFWLLLLPLSLAIAELSRRARAGAVAHPKILRAEAAPGRLLLTGSPAAAPRRPRVRWRLWLGLSLATVALARPQWGEVEEQVFDQAREILIAVDLSRSMLAPDVPPSRLERARLLITSLLEQLEGERVGLLVFAGTAFLQSPLSADYEILREFLPALEPDFLPQGGTDYAGMLQAALDGFGRTDGTDRFLIVLSDGEAQEESWRTHLDELSERGVKVIALGIGTAEGAMLPDQQGGFVKDERGAVVLSRLNPSTLEELVRRTGGVYRDASSWVDLAQLLRDTVEAGRQGAFTEVSRVRRVERFQWALAPAFLLLLLSFWREFPVHPRPRTLPLQRAAAPRAAAATATAAMLAAAATTLAVFAPRLSAQTGENTFAAPLSQTVARLSGRDTLAASDYEELARTTVTYGQRMLNSQQPPEPGVVQDALAAVAAGEHLDPKATDWDRLREELEALQPPEPPESQEPPPQDQQNEQDQEQNSQQNQDKSSKSQQDESDSKESDQPQSQESGENGQDEPSKPEPSPEQESAFGEMDQPPQPPEPSDEPPRETQQVGGQTERPYDPELDPAMTVPLQKLEQLRRQDSPAELYQLMQDPNARPSEKGRDW